MFDLTRAEWAVLDILWECDSCTLPVAVEKLFDSQHWSRNTVHTYFTRMEDKGLVGINRNVRPHTYYALISRDDCARLERDTLLNNIYKGSLYELLKAYLCENSLTREQKESLKNIIEYK